MEALLNELRKLGAKVEHDIYGYTTVNGRRVSINVSTDKKGRTHYEIGYTKKYQSARNAAYFIMTDYLPSLTRIDKLLKVKDIIKPLNESIYMTRDGELRIMTKTAEELVTLLKQIGELLSKDLK